MKPQNSSSCYDIQLSSLQQPSQQYQILCAGSEGKIVLTDNPTYDANKGFDKQVETMKQEFEKNFVTEDQNQSKFNDNSIICTIGQISNKQFTDQNKFEWLPCSFILKQISKTNTSIISLSSQLKFGNPKTQQVCATCLSIQMDKSFTYDEEMGWNWHKSWILPNITAKLSIIDPVTNEQFDHPSDVYAQVVAVKASSKEISNFHLIDINLRGTSKLKMENGQATFSTLKFNSTSYNNDGIKFNLLLIITRENSQWYDYKNDSQADSNHNYNNNTNDSSSNNNSKENGKEIRKAQILQDESNAGLGSNESQIISAFISPPIFVDSRKSARETAVLRDIKSVSFYDIFPPEVYDRLLIKRTKQESSQVQEEIKNDLDGFVSYLTAPNIRNKVKHPFFLAYKFNGCMDLYYNTLKFKVKDVEEIALKALEILVDFGRKSQKNKKNKKHQNFLGKFNTNAYLTLLIQSADDKYNSVRKITEQLGSLDNSVLNIVFDKNFISDNFQKFPDTLILKQSYEKSYVRFCKSMQKVDVPKNQAEEHTNSSQTHSSYYETLSKRIKMSQTIELQNHSHFQKTTQAGIGSEQLQLQQESFSQENHQFQQNSLQFQQPYSINLKIEPNIQKVPQIDQNQLQQNEVQQQQIVLKQEAQSSQNAEKEACINQQSLIASNSQIDVKNSFSNNYIQQQPNFNFPDNNGCSYQNGLINQTVGLNYQNQLSYSHNIPSNFQQQQQLLVQLQPVSFQTKIENDQLRMNSLNSSYTGNGPFQQQYGPSMSGINPVLPNQNSFNAMNQFGNQFNVQYNYNN